MRLLVSGRRGQSLILAVMIMFLLAFLGMIFIAMVTRNLFRAGRSNEALRCEQLAKAGIEYADAMLTRDQAGADWRPVPEHPDHLTAQDILVAHPEAADDPDYKWVVAPLSISERFSRINFGEGRFLLRVSYNPDPNDPMSKYIKIESIGRIGAVDFADPTTLASAAQSGLRVEMTAYKPIGVTDYLRFITNKEKRATPIPLGAPGCDVVFGDPDNGAPMRVNGNLIWQGGTVQLPNQGGNPDWRDAEVDIYLRAAAYTQRGDPLPRQMPIDTVAVAGEISHAVDPGAAGLANLYPADPLAISKMGRTSVRVHRTVAGVLTPLRMLDSAGVLGVFNTFGGFYRDVSDLTDMAGLARGVRRVEPPVLDAYDESSKMMRYRALTRNSGKWDIDPDGNSYNTGWYGWGRGVYIDNYGDVQRESETLFGGYTLRADWMKPNNEMSPYWRGPYYIPPGVQIVLNPYKDGNGDYFITLTRTDIDRTGRKYVWRDQLGAAQRGWGQTIHMKYPENGVIYAEGNIRIKGMLPPDTQLTVVSGATIYIEGSVLKNRPRGSIDPDPTCAIALLARDYVCVNTTQFVSLLAETAPTQIGSDSQTGDPPFHLIITPDPESSLRTCFSFGPADYLTTGFNPFLCVRHAGQYEGAYINMWVNRGMNAGFDPAGSWGLYDFRDFTNHDFTLPFAGNGTRGWWDSGLRSAMYGLGDSFCGGTPGVGLETVFEHRTWSLQVDTTLNVNPVGSLTPAVGYPNYLEVALDQTTRGRSNYLLSGFTVQPLDVVIEAIIYAQDKSFFVIPGPWFNPNPDDTQANYTARGARPLGTDPRFPFFGQRLDIKITVRGAVTENLPASAGDVSEWTIKWSPIPEHYGSSDAHTYHQPIPVGNSTRSQGIEFVYDPALSGSVIRKEPDWPAGYGRTLPAAPNLPVSSTLIYYGEAV